MGSEAKKRPGRTRPTIGLLTDTVILGYQAIVLKGVADLVRERDANLLCFVGGILRSGVFLETQRNVLYDLVGEKTVDGLVILSGTIGTEVSLDELKEFCERYRPLPMAGIALALPGVPSVVLDNFQSMREAVTHLIETHGYQRIGFIRKHEGHLEADERYRAYAETLAERGIPLNPDIVVPGRFYDDVSVGVHWLLDERKQRPQVELEALVAVDDHTARRVLDVFQERGIRVPDDIALVGFDDVEDSKYLVPPLTTVRQSLYDQGRIAAEMVLAQLQGEAVPEQQVLHAELVVRQSCGCPDPAVARSAAGPAARSSEEGETFADAFAARREDILSEIRQVLNPAGADPASGGVLRQVERVLDAFAAEFEDAGTGDAGTFAPVLGEVVQQTVKNGGNLGVWQTAISVLRRHAQICFDEPEALRRAEDLWYQAQVSVARGVQQLQVSRRRQAEQQEAALGGIGQNMNAIVDVEEMMDVIVEELPNLGIPSAYLSLYEGPEGPAQWSELILAYDGKVRLAVEAEKRRFPTDQLLPAELWPSDRLYCMVVNPLFFKDRQLGTVILEMGPRAGAVYETLRVQLSGTLARTLLVQEREKLLDETRKLNRDLQVTLATQAHLLETIQQLSTPVVPMMEGIILLPLVGHIDSTRAQQIMETLLAAVQKHRARAAIVDITGVAVVDTAVANSLVSTAQATGLLGCEVILVGIRPEVAQTIVGLGVDLTNLITSSDLRRGIEYALRPRR